MLSDEQREARNAKKREWRRNNLEKSREQSRRNQAKQRAKNPEKYRTWLENGIEPTKKDIERIVADGRENIQIGLEVTEKNTIL